ncbi:MAG: metallophosphoesterase [Candidatus Omnitrophica bacterium]|nr:metallophosphoesterase [Candidatus Omnitrophota bacterium]
MRIGVISDTHIPERAQSIPTKVIKGLKECEVILHAGDLVELKVLDILRDITDQVVAVYGNMDYPAVKKRLPSKQIIELENLRIGLFHGWGSPHQLMDIVRDVFKSEKVDIIIFGHSHYPINEDIEGIRYFNPGSPTDKVFSPFNSYGILEIEKKKIKKAEIVKI